MNDSSEIAVDWEKAYDDEEFAKLEEKLRDKPCTYDGKILAFVEKDRNGKLSPRYFNEIANQISFELLVQLKNWQRTLPKEQSNRVEITLPRSCRKFNEESRLPDIIVWGNFDIWFNANKNSPGIPCPSPDFVIEVSKLEERDAAKLKIQNSYFADGTNTIVALLICHGEKIGQLQLEFFVKRDDQCISVFEEPIWRNVNANEIAELNEIIPGFIFDFDPVEENLSRFK